MMENKFNLIDQNRWPRAQLFYYFSQMAPTGYTINVNMDVSRLYKVLKEKGRKFFPAYLYLVTRCLNTQPEFKTAYHEDKLGYWDSLTPLYAAFHDDDKTFSFLYTEYDGDFRVFYDRYLDDKRKYGNRRTILSKPDTPPPNCYTVSCVPWISFTGFSLHTYGNNKYYLPSVEAGKFAEKNGVWMMPLSLTLHHAATDGIHVKTFLEDLQNLMDSAEGWV